MSTPGIRRCHARRREHVPEEQNVIHRMSIIPLFSSSCGVVIAIYNSTKDRSPYLRSVCDVAEKSTKILAGAAAFGAQPLIAIFEPQIATANELLCKGLDKLESALPILQQSPEKVIADTKELVTGTQDAVTNTVAGARNTVIGVVGLAINVVNSSVDVTKTVFATMGSHVEQLVTTSIDTALVKSEEWVDRHLPVDEDLDQHDPHKVVLTTEQKQRMQQKYSLRLGLLSLRFHHCAYELSLGKVKHASNGTLEVLTELHRNINLIESTRQNIHCGLGKLHQLWLEWKEKQLRPMPVGMERESLGEPLESLVLSMIQAATQQLQTSCLNLATVAQGFPAHIQESIQRLWRHAQDLHSSFSVIETCRDLSLAILTKNHKHIVRTYLIELYNYTNAQISVPGLIWLQRFWDVSL
ncbi:Hypothetical predicted protein [Pelobates cultripes]|uniref:Perilipin n=1 Tax=Pelobates cultripes TaxID=61616 RepID=A0AAD1S5Y5_PELCU|nr:Hypothetical predicted protein [Pelobates cultripes]